MRVQELHHPHHVLAERLPLPPLRIGLRGQGIVHAQQVTAQRPVHDPHHPRVGPLCFVDHLVLPHRWLGRMRIEQASINHKPGLVKLIRGHAIERALDDQERKPPMDVIEFRPERDQYAFTFGGVAPVRKVQPGTMLRLWTDDAFCGNLREPSDMPSAKLTMPFVNPQTGPFYVEGAEPGDTLALHFVDLSPARDFGASSTIPLFGGLTGTDRTATLQDPLEERTWIYQADRDRRTVLFQARASDLRL